MRTIYILIFAICAGACSSTYNLSDTLEDDIYFVPGKNSLLAQELSNKTNQTTRPNTTEKNSSRPIDPTLLAKEQAEANSGKVNPKSYNIGMARYATEKQVTAAKAKHDVYIDTTSKGYWIGGFKGSNQDLEECVRIMNRYPEGFATYGNNYEIAINLSYNPDWNVFTVNNRYWWFPSYTNTNLYSSLIFGTYPRYIWTVIWNDLRYDHYTFDYQFNFRPGFYPGNYFGHNNWDFHWYWGTSWNYPFWHDYWSWNYGWRYDPWRYWNGYWGYHRPGFRPDWGGIIIHPSNKRPHYATRVHYTGNRNARTYSSYTRSSRYSTYKNTYNHRNNTNNSGSTSGHPNYSNANQSRGNSSYGRSSTSRTGKGTGTIKRNEHKRER